jgi:hypothetical protein
VGWATFWAIFSQTHLITLLLPPFSDENSPFDDMGRIFGISVSLVKYNFYQGILDKLFLFPGCP